MGHLGLLLAPCTMLWMGLPLSSSCVCISSITSGSCSVVRLGLCFIARGIGILTASFMACFCLALIDLSLLFGIVSTMTTMMMMLPTRMMGLTLT